MRLRTILAPAAALGLAVSLVTSGATSASAASDRASARPSGAAYVVLTGGATSLAVNPDTAQALADSGLTVAPASEAKATDRGFAFPIQGGVLRAKNLAGTINHSGGLTFSGGGQELTIRDFTINTRARTLSAFVDETGRRLVVLDLKLNRAKVKIGKKSLTISRVKAELAEGAAAALNAYFGVDVFEAGLKVGTAKVSARSMVLRG